MKWAGTFLFLFYLVGCQSNLKTTVSENHFGELKSLVDANNRTIKITPETVVIDARAYYLYNLKHVPNSIQLNWNDLFGLKKLKLNTIKIKSKNLIKRLALKGIHPSKDILVLGSGDRGNGEAASLSWVLFNLGIKKIQFANIYEFDFKLTKKRPTAKANEDAWKYKKLFNFSLSKSEINRTQNLFVIDVRSKKEYMIKSLSGLINLELGTIINIPYQEFLTFQGRPDTEIVSKLLSIGITKKQHIVLVSNKGKRATAAAMSLLSQGWPKTHVLLF